MLVQIEGHWFNPDQIAAVVKDARARPASKCEIWLTSGGIVKVHDSTADEVVKEIARQTTRAVTIPG